MFALQEGIRMFWVLWFILQIKGLHELTPSFLLILTSLMTSSFPPPDAKAREFLRSLCDCSFQLNQYFWSRWHVPGYAMRSSYTEPPPLHRALLIILGNPECYYSALSYILTNKGKFMHARACTHTHTHSKHSEWNTLFKIGKLGCDSLSESQVPV